MTTELDRRADAAPSGWRPTRRVVLKAGALFGALAATWGTREQSAAPAEAAQTSTGKTRSQRWSPADDQGKVVAAEADGSRAVTADFPYYAVGASWPGAAGTSPQVELSFNTDDFASTVVTHAAVEDGGRLNRDGRVFTHLVFVDAATTVRYRTLDANGAPMHLDGFELVFIDASAGPRGGGKHVSAASLPTLEKPPVISRADWGADESLRFDAYGEIWPREYRLVSHVIVHHTVTENGQDPYITVRTIYEYHAVEQGWGDIGYNYLVGYDGTIFEGRAGGDNVVGGHSFQYSFGSSGIGTMGDFSAVDVTDDCWAALIAIIAWVGRNLDPLGASTFHEAPDLPTICGHRDTNITECPGDFLYADLSGLRNAVANVINNATIPPDSGVPAQDGEFGTGDNVIVSRPANLRDEPAAGTHVITQLPVGTFCAVDGGARIIDGDEWYYVLAETGVEGYTLGRYLDPAPPGNPPAAIFELGDEVKVVIDDLNLHRRPGIAQESHYMLPRGAYLRISVAPVAATGYRWYGVITSDNASGWVAQEGITLAARRRLALSPSSGAVGKLVTATATGMPAGYSAGIEVEGEQVTTFLIDANGRGVVQFKMPPAVKGRRSIRAIRGVARAYNRYNVTPRIAISPRSGQTGASIKVVLSGYDAADTVDIQLRHGATYETLTTVTTGDDGGVHTTIIIPDWASGKPIIQGKSAASNAQTRLTVNPASAAEQPTSTPTQTPTPEPTATATATPVPTESATPEPTASPTSAPTESPTPEPSATATPEPTGTPAPEPTESPTPEPQPTETPET